MIEKKITVLSIAVALALTACGGGGSSGTGTGSVGGTPATATTAAGKAVDGYLSGASVLCDANNNGVADAGEAVVVTDAQGNFTFSPACSSTIVVSGGTSIDTGLPFAGTLKAPAGSTFATPLTTLMVSGGLSAAQVAVALGLPAGTDVSQVDPVSNSDLYKKTLALQQVIQQTTETLGALAQDASPATIQAIYSQVAKAVVTTLAANPTIPLVDVSGNVSNSLVSGIVLQSVNNVAATTDPALTTTQSSLAGFSASSVATLISGAIANQAQTLAQSSDAALIGQATLLQSTPTIANATSQVAALLTTGVSGQVNLAAVGGALQQLSSPDGSSDATAISSFLGAIATQSQAAGIPPPAVTIGDLSKRKNYLAIQNDSITIGGDAYNLRQFLNGITLRHKPSPIDTFSFAFDVFGRPIPKNAGGVMTTRVSLAVEVADAGGSGRVLQLAMDKADLTMDNKQQLTIVVPAGARMYAYGKTSKDVSANLTLTNIAANQFVAVADNTLTFNTGNVLKRILGQIEGQSGGVFSNLQNLTGTFNMKFVVSNLNVGSETDKSAVRGLSVGVTGSGQPPVNGLGVKGVMTIP
ncbi:hypothetical protein [Paraherbaspirillum soli]|uniref:Carboxypeptidase regulatory-like domain-containing protein n=1 Tax=Paraherbaspirillum soli TaxID=631222 RepID=A0ABW0M926_9BURK